MPKKMVGVWNAAFSDQETRPERADRRGRASRIGGEIAASDEPGLDKFAFFLMMLGTVNFASHVQPGSPAAAGRGHILGALWRA